MTTDVGVARTAVEHPERLAVRDEFGASYSYAELDTAINRLINALADRGVGPGDVIGLLLGNRAETILLHQVAYRGGLRYTPINPRLRTAEVEYLVDDSGAKVLFADVAHLELATPAAEATATPVIVVGGDVDEERSLERLIDSGTTDAVPYSFGSVMSYTSGTTGRPKAVERDRIVPPQEVVAKMFRFGLRLGFDPEHDRHLTTAPLYHGGPLISAMHGINLGGSVHLLDRFDPEYVLEVIARERITSMYMVPTMYHRMLRLPEEVRLSADVSSLRSVMHTGAPCPPVLKQGMIDWLGPIIYECYAATEGYGTYTVCTSDDWLQHRGTVGKPEHDVITIRDPSGAALPPGEIGLVYARTLPGVAPFRYRGDPEKTAQAYGPDGDYTLGDMGFLDDEGFLYLTGRASDMIISGGVNIYPAEVEQVLLRHPAVADAAVFGVPDLEWGEVVVAAVEIRPEADVGEDITDDIVRFCRAEIATYKAPRQVHVVDSVGRDPSGKLRKSLLRDAILAESDST